MRQGACRDADSSIGNDDAQESPRRIIGADRYATAGGREFDRILKQIPDDLLKSCGVDVHVAPGRIEVECDGKPFGVRFSAAHFDHPGQALMGLDKPTDTSVGIPKGFEGHIVGYGDAAHAHVHHSPFRVADFEHACSLNAMNSAKLFARRLELCVAA
jgi:hypothetical protein